MKGGVVGAENTKNGESFAETFIHITLNTVTFHCIIVSLDVRRKKYTSEKCVYPKI